MKAFKKVQALQVASRREGALLGKIDDFQFELETGIIFGFRVSRGVFSKSGGVAAAAVERIGRDLVYVSEEASIEWGGAPRAAVEGRAWASEYKGTKLMSRRGEGLGSVEDFVVEAGPARVAALLLDQGRVVVYDERIAVGRDAVILADPAEAVPRPEGDEESADWWGRMRGLFDSEK